MTLDLETVIRYSPVFVFHEQEKYFPCSIEHLLKGSILHIAQNKKGGFSQLENPTQTDLSENPNKANFVEINKSQFTGMPLGESPIYYSVQKFDSFIEVHYLMLYAFRGSHSFTVESVGSKEVNFVGHDYGQHQGGISRVTVRLVLIDDMRNDYKVFQVGFENDRHMFFDTRDNIKLVGNEDGSALTHPLVHVGLYGHNCWNRVIRTPIIVKDKGPKSFAISCLGEESPIWKPFQGGASSFKQVGFEKVMNEYKVIEPEIWVSFKGKLGKDSANQWTNAPTDLEGNKLLESTAKELEFMKDPDVAFEAYTTNLKDNLSTGTAPSGLANQYYVYPDKSSSQTIENT